MAGKASDYHRGDMDITEQVSTFHLVMGITKWGSLAIAAFLLLITLWFCTSAGFLGALVPAIIVAAVTGHARGPLRAKTRLYGVVEELSAQAVPEAALKLKDRNKRRLELASP